jgi:uncharacterized protein
MDIPQLSQEELRVLGVLMEKSKLTPDYYPMTVNAITAACNQKTSRFPVVDYSEETVQQALSALKAQSLVATAVGGSSRSVKYKHNFSTVLETSEAVFAVICLLMLRGPQTAGEINSNAGRLFEFQSSASVQEVLRELAQRDPPWVRELPRSPGQKENRFVHLFSSEDQAITETSLRSSNDLEARLSSLEHQVADLRQIVDRLLSQQTLNNSTSPD